MANNDLTNIVVPEGMWLAAISSKGGTSCDPFDIRLRYCLEAAILWLSENPIVPIEEWAQYAYDGAKGSHVQALVHVITEWQRMMFSENASRRMFTTSLDPYSENYVGHIEARRLGAPCICPPGERHIMCPYHGR